MSDKEKDDNEITWGVNERGDLLIDGIVVEKNTRYYPPDFEPKDEDDTPQGQVNAAVEGQSAEPDKAPEPEPVVEPPPPEPAKISEKQKFKLMVRGEMQEREYSTDELVARLQMAESYGLKNDEIREKYKKVEHLIPIAERPDFKEWLQAKVEMGEIQAPAPAPMPDSTDVIKYRLRTQEPEFNEIRQQMIAWAATLPDEEAELLNNSHRAFVDAYDHFKTISKRTTLPPAPAAPAPVVPKKDIEKVIAAKEVIKKEARVEPPGDAPVEVDPNEKWEKEDRRLRNAVRRGEKFVHYNGKRMEAEVAWVMHRTG